MRSNPLYPPYLKGEISGKAESSQIFVFSWAGRIDITPLRAQNTCAIIWLRQIANKGSTGKAI